MAISVSIQPPSSTSVDVTGGQASTSLSVASGQLIEKKFFQSSSQPITNVNEGDLWYDLTLSKLKLRGTSAWNSVAASGEELDGDYFRFTSDSVLSSGNLAEFKNNTTTSFSIRYDGVLTLKDQASAPSAVANGLYSDGTNLYFGKE